MNERLRHAATLLSLVLCLAYGTGARATPPPLSPDQRRHLDAGDVVLLDMLPPGASSSAQGGTAVAVVCAAPSVVWNVLVDYRNHPAIYPRVTRAEVVHANASRVRVRYTVSIGPFPVDVDMDKYPDAARRRVEWHLAEERPNRFFSESSGTWQVDEAGAASIVTYAVATRSLVPGFMTRASHRDSLVATVAAVRTQAKHPAGCGSR